MSFPQVDPLDWRTIQPHVDALLAAELTPATADAWLQQWSDLASVLYRGADAQINRKVTENTADEEADSQFLVFVEQIMPQARVADAGAARPAAGAASAWLHARARRSRAAPPLPRRGGHLLRGKRADPQRVDEAGKPVRQDHGRAEYRLERHDRDDPAGPPALAEPGPRRARESHGGWSWRPTWLSGRSSTSSTCKCSASAARSQRTPGCPTTELTSGRSWRASTTRRPTASRSTTPSSTRSSRWRGRSTPSRQTSWGWTRSDPGTPTSTRNGEPLRPFKEVADLEAGCYRIFNQVDPELAAHFAVMRDGLPRPALARQQGGRRVLRGLPGHRQALHLHERRRHP